MHTRLELRRQPRKFGESIGSLELRISPYPPSIVQCILSRNGTQSRVTIYGRSYTAASCTLYTPFRPHSMRLLWFIYCTDRAQQNDKTLWCCIYLSQHESGSSGTRSGLFNNGIPFKSFVDSSRSEVNLQP